MGEWLRQATAPGLRFVAAPDAGFFVDGVSIATNNHSYRNMFIGVDPIWNATKGGSISPACLAYYASEPW